MELVRSCLAGAQTASVEVRACAGTADSSTVRQEVLDRRRMCKGVEEV